MTNSALLFIGIVGLEIKDLGDFVMIPAYIIVIVTAGFGCIIATHHRVRQKQKFSIITMYEEKLELFELKKDIIIKGDLKSGIVGKIFTAGFIRFVHLGIGIVGFVLLLKRIICST